MCRVPDTRGENRLFLVTELAASNLRFGLAIGKTRKYPADPDAGIHHMKSLKSEWTEEELKQLAAIVAAGGTALRAAAKFNRRIASCRSQARKMGVPFENSKIRRKNILAKCAAVEKELSR